MAEKWIVLKFGGTSVAARSQWETIASLAVARRSEGFRVLLVCSAVSGVTNLLNTLADQPDSRDRLEELLDIHRKLGQELGVNEQEWLPECQQQLNGALLKLSQEPGPQYRAALLAMGEKLSTRIGFSYLRQLFDTTWVDVREALEIVHEKDFSPARQWLSADCSPAQDPDLSSRWAALSPILITEGFVARTQKGDTALLGRGGSDTSAALLAGRLSAQRLEIWTDVPGLFSADPGLIEDARLLREVDYAEALEMAASGANVVHPRSIRAAAATNTPVLIRDLKRRGVAGTRIGPTFSDETGIKAVACQEDMAVILLQIRFISGWGLYITIILVLCRMMTGSNWWAALLAIAINMIFWQFDYLVTPEPYTIVFIIYFAMMMVSGRNSSGTSQSARGSRRSSRSALLLSGRSARPFLARRRASPVHG